jgi:hypothetical protein
MPLRQLIRYHPDLRLNAAHGWIIVVGYDENLHRQLSRPLVAIAWGRPDLSERDRDKSLPLIGDIGAVVSRPALVTSRTKEPAAATLVEQHPNSGVFTFRNLGAKQLPPSEGADCTLDRNPHCTE